MKNRLRLSAVLAGACFLTFALPLAAHAASPDVGYGVSAGGNRLIIFDPLNPSAAGEGTPIAGLGTGEQIAAIDTRPTTKQLYAVSDDGTSNGRLYLINTSTATATRIGTTVYSLGGTLTSTSGSGPAHFDIDFSPVDDTLRLVGSDQLNMRVNADTGAVISTGSSLTYAAGDPNASATFPPSVAGAAYTGPTGEATTTLFDVDYGDDYLVRQGDANVSTPTSVDAGTLHSIGSTGLFASGTRSSITNLLGLDASGSTGNLYLAALISTNNAVSSATQMYVVNPTTGAATTTGIMGSNAVGGTSNADILETFAVGPAPVAPASLPDLGMPAVAAVAVIGAGALTPPPPPPPLCLTPARPGRSRPSLR